MRARFCLPVVFAAAFCAPAAHARDCEIQSSNLDAFAKYRLGQPLRALPSGVKRLPNCAIYAKRRNFDCEFVDVEGTHYVASGREISRLERRYEGAGALPPSYPLKFGMPLNEARRILSAIAPNAEFTASRSDNGYGLNAGECLKDSHGITYYFAADFDKARRLNKLTAAFATAGD